MPQITIDLPDSSLKTTPEKLPSEIREEVLQILRLHQEELKNLGVKSLELFGSVARNEAKSDSDVDLLVELSESMSLFQFIKVKLYIQDLLNCAVDLGTKDALHEHLRQAVIEESVYVF